MRLREMMEKQGVTRREVAEALQVSSVAVSKWVNCQAYPSADKLPVLANLLGCTIDQLFDIDRAE